MIVYNVTVKITNQAHDEWFKWMKSEHIQEVLDTGYFVENAMYKVVLEDDDGVTYSIQYLATSKENLQKYFDHESLRLQAKTKKKFEGQYVAFRTILERV